MYARQGQQFFAGQTGPVRIVPKSVTRGEMTGECRAGRDPGIVPTDLREHDETSRSAPGACRAGLAKIVTGTEARYIRTDCQTRKCQPSRFSARRSSAYIFKEAAFCE